MKYVFINNSQNLTNTDILTGQIILVKNSNIYNLIEELKRLKIKSTDILVLNAEERFESEDKYTDFDGIRLLKWLRIHLKLLNRIVITSFLTREFLLQNRPKDYILFAPDNYFLQIPFSIAQLQNISKKNQVIINEDVLIKKYKPFVSPDFEVAEFSHSFSNVFGLYLLENLYQQIVNGSNCELPHNNLQFSKAKMLYDLNHNVLEYKDNLKDKRSSTSKLLKNKKIVYVDDQGKGKGWFSLIRRLIDVSEDQLKGVEPEQLNNRDNTINYTNTIEKIINHKPDIIFLDLRLLGDYEKNLNIESTSGSVLLRKIREWQPSIPVLLTSATDRIKSFDVLNKSPYNINAIWTKPRVDKKGFNATKTLLDLYKKIQAIAAQSNDKIGLQLIEIDYRIKNRLLPEINSNFVNNFDYIIFDTNYFCDTYGDLTNNIMSLMTIVEKEECTVKPVIIDDVVKEVYLNSYKKKVNASFSRVSRFSSKLISQLFNTNKVFSLYKEVASAVEKKLIAECEPVDDNPATKKHNIFYSLKIKQTIASSKDKAEKKTDELNEEIKQNQGIIHADNIFKHLIRLLQKKGNKVLFVSNDINCKRDIVVSSNYKRSVNQVFKADYQKDINGDVLLDSKGRKKRTHKFKHNPDFDVDEYCKLMSNNKFIELLKETP